MDARSVLPADCFPAGRKRVHNCRTPGTMPNGMNMMTMTKIAPSSEFQRSM